MYMALNQAGFEGGLRLDLLGDVRRLLLVGPVSMMQLCKESYPFAAQNTLIVKGTDKNALFISVTVKVRKNVSLKDIEVGMPVICPLGLNLMPRPCGRPPSTDQVYGGLPPDAINVVL